MAEMYDALVSYRAPVAFYADLIRRAGQPALELGCGTGHPLLELLRQGLNVHGLDASRDMLARCQAKAQAQGPRECAAIGSGDVVSKAGLIHLTRCLAVALAPSLTVNCVAPGLIEGTRMSARVPPARVAALKEQAALSAQRARRTSRGRSCSTVDPTR